MVLLDINMPELNGFEVAAKIRKQNHQVLIFFLSDRSDKADRLKGFDLQANDYLAKPFYPEEICWHVSVNGFNVQTTELKQKAIHSEKVHLTIPPMK